MRIKIRNKERVPRGSEETKYVSHSHEGNLYVLEQEGEGNEPRRVVGRVLRKVYGRHETGDNIISFSVDGFVTGRAMIDPSISRREEEKVLESYQDRSKLSQKRREDGFL